VANSEHLEILKQGVEVWNKWREDNSDVQPDLSGADLFRADLIEMNLKAVNLSGATLTWAGLIKADLSDAILTGADLREAYLREAVLTNANLREATLIGANLIKADLSGADLQKANLSGVAFGEADLTNANLRGARLIGASLQMTTLKGADLSECEIYGISVWDVETEGTIQSDLVVNKLTEPTITVDSLEVAQFIYLLLHNEKIRSVIDTLTSKVVLILGRFTPGRKKILSAIKGELHKRNYVPVLFDFDKPASRTTTETISILARMSRFVIADITEAKSVLQELQEIVPNTPSVPVQPLLLASDHKPGMFDHFESYPWVLQPHFYNNQEDLLESLEIKVITPAEEKLKELRKR